MLKIRFLRVLQDKKKLSGILSDHRNQEQNIGFVPTMGALHDGHLSLVQRALKENDLVVVSIFVNPTQFNNQKDLKKYPRTLDRDVETLESLKDDRVLIFAPAVDDIYGNAVTSEKFSFNGLEHAMEGKFRPGHFDGVATVVHRLFQIVKPRRAYFGKKDFQQLLIIKSLVKQLKLPVEVVGCEIKREADGLAMSSRNLRLSRKHREKAPLIYEILKESKVKFGTISAAKVTEWVEARFAKIAALELEYFIIAEANTLNPVKRKSKKKKYRAFIAAYAGDVRLIDNIALN
ncbi:MAG: pantoate--beta-alanine ligase [Bacteroidia bacterium]|nr:pantoate--beta-alanine ligase [Bacteroidia bacterium]